MMAGLPEVRMGEEIKKTIRMVVVIGVIGIIFMMLYASYAEESLNPQLAYYILHATETVLGI